MRSNRSNIWLVCREICVDGQVHCTDLLTYSLVKGKKVQTEIYRFPETKKCSCYKPPLLSFLSKITSVLAAVF